ASRLGMPPVTPSAERERSAVKAGPPIRAEVDDLGGFRRTDDQRPTAPIRQAGCMAVRLNVTFCVLSPALAHARRLPLGKGARTRALGRRGGPDVRVMDCALGPGGPGFCPSSAKGGRKAGS